MRTRALAIYVVVVLGLLDLPGLIAPGPAAADLGFLGINYLGASAPTGQKPQSKLWVVGDTWFASMYNVLTSDFEIYRLDSSSNTWSSTGTLIDERSRSSADVLWNGNALYVVSASTSTMTAGTVKISRYAYDTSSKTFSRDSGFPVTIHTGIIETVVMDKDTTGKLWVTFTEGNKVYVAHSTTDDRTWTNPFVLPVTGASNLDPDDISAVVAYNGRIGVMWSNQVDSAMHFASHEDGDADSVWTSNTAIQQTGYADDHMNLKALAGDPSGQVFAATKTSLNDSGSSGPLILLMVLGNDNVWRRYTFSTVPDNDTRPVVAIDRQNRRIYEFASAPCCNGGAIYYKETDLDNPSFSAGLGTPFLESLTNLNINNPTSTKQELNGTTDLLVMASDDQTHNYWHGMLDLAGSVQVGTPGPPTPAGPSGLTLPADTTKPVLYALSLSLSAFRAAPRRPSGATVRYRLSEAATVEFRIERATPGRGYRRLKGGLSDVGRKGANRFKLTGRLNGKALSPGRYRLAATPTDAASNRGHTIRASFRMLAPRRKP
jgi:hypothetical protein